MSLLLHPQVQGSPETSDVDIKVAVCNPTLGRHKQTKSPDLNITCKITPGHQARGIAGHIPSIRCVPDHITVSLGRFGCMRKYRCYATPPKSDFYRPILFEP